LADVRPISAFDIAGAKADDFHGIAHGPGNRGKVTERDGTAIIK
jgi:hypothetical protein